METTTEKNKILSLQEETYIKIQSFGQPRYVRRSERSKQNSILAIVQRYKDGGISRKDYIAKLAMKSLPARL